MVGAPAGGGGGAQERECLELSPGKCGEEGQEEEEVRPRRNNRLWELLRGRVHLEDSDGGWGRQGAVRQRMKAGERRGGPGRLGRNGMAAPRSLRLSKRL